MADNIIESYLVSLGFKVNPEDAEKYLDIKRRLNQDQEAGNKADEQQGKQAQKRDKDADQSVRNEQRRSQQRTQQRTTENKQQLALLNELRRGIAQVGNVWEGVATGDILGAMASGMQSAMAFKKTIEAITQMGIPSAPKQTAAQPASAKPAPQAQTPSQSGAQEHPEPKEPPFERARTELRPEARPMQHQVQPQAVPQAQPTAKTQPVSQPKSTSAEPVPEQPAQAPARPQRRTRSRLLQAQAEPQPVQPVESPVQSTTATPQAAAAQPTAPEVISPQIDTKNVDAASKSFGGLNKQLATTGQNMKAIKTTTGEVIGGDGTAMAGAEAADQASAALLTSLTAATGIGIAVVGVVAGTTAAVKGMYDLADGVSTANTNIESMAAKMWISYGAAWQLQNTLSAMGKTTADLNDIALNPTLREQFKTLQDFQKSQLQLPADFQTVNQQWAQSVQLPEQELKETLQYIQEIAGYDLSRAFAGPLNTGLTAALKTAEEAANDFSKIAGWIDYIGSGLEKVYSTIINFEKQTGILKTEISSIPVIGQISDIVGGISDIGKLVNKMPSAPKSNASSKSGSSSTASTSALQVYNVPSYSDLAPNSPSNTYNLGGGVNVTSSPTNNINIYTGSNDPYTIASAASSAVQANNGQTALIKSVQGLSR